MGSAVYGSRTIIRAGWDFSSMQMLPSTGQGEPRCWQAARHVICQHMHWADFAEFLTWRAGSGNVLNVDSLAGMRIG
jgi:hypothetical protein